MMQPDDDPRLIDSHNIVLISRAKEHRTITCSWQLQHAQSSPLKAFTKDQFCMRAHLTTARHWVAGFILDQPCLNETQKDFQSHKQ